VDKAQFSLMLRQVVLIVTIVAYRIKDAVIMIFFKTIQNAYREWKHSSTHSLLRH